MDSRSCGLALEYCDVLRKKRRTNALEQGRTNTTNTLSERQTGLDRSEVTDVKTHGNGSSDKENIR